jgi:hypothetical protein
VHVEDLHNVLLIHVPLFNVGPMVVLRILHTSLLHMIDPAKLQFHIRNVKDSEYKSYNSELTYVAQLKWTGIEDILVAQVQTATSPLQGDDTPLHSKI